MAGGRPPKLTDEERKEVYEALEQFIKTEEDPTIVWFTSHHEIANRLNITRDDINNWDEFYTLRNKAIEKQESYLVRQATQNKINPTIAIFRLKQPQHGYKDRVDTDITSGGETLAPVLVRFMGDTNTPSQTD